MGHYTLCLKTHACLGALHGNLNADRSVLSATDIAHWL